ncbi:MAG TPA: zinc ribbon domain-containing protein [Coleofasciculaceae cyanobacterium]
MARQKANWQAQSEEGSYNHPAWYHLSSWLERFRENFGKLTVAVMPAYTSQACSSCGTLVKKSVSMRTHAGKCGFVLDTHGNAAINIVSLALSTTGHVGTGMHNPNALPRFAHQASPTPDATSTVAGAILSGQVGSLNEQYSP